MRALLFVAVLGICSPLLQAKKFDRCSFARELAKYDVSLADMSAWVCIAQHESSFNTRAINTNTNRSMDWGIFQINDYWWCDPRDGRKSHNICKLNCSDMLGDDIAKALRCALIVKKQQGNKAWVAWNSKCQGTRPNVRDCF